MKRHWMEEASMREVERDEAMATIKQLRADLASQQATTVQTHRALTAIERERDMLREQLEAARLEATVGALEIAAEIADQHWPESGHVHPDEAISCQMSISVMIRRLQRQAREQLAALPR